MKLTFCGNVHPVETLADWAEAVRSCDAAVAKLDAEARGTVEPFGLGVWWNAAMAAELREDRNALERVQDVLEATGQSIWTLNVFPYGNFHADIVKAAVYEPSWADPARARYTLDAAAAVAALVPVGSTIPLSTVPLGFGGVPLDACVTELRRVVDALADLEQESGTTVQLALEAEPFCVLERAAQVAAFLENWVFVGVDARTEERLRRHLGVCLDLCHAAVMREDPVAAVQDLRRRAIALPKVQVASCLELRATVDATARAAAFDALLEFDEPRFLHQTVAENGLRVFDLKQLRRRRDEFATAGRLRTHFHVPVDWDDDGPLGSTRAEVAAFLRSVRDVPVLEVETYTWSVLDEAALPGREPVSDEPHEDGPPLLARRIAAELRAVREMVG